MKEETKTTSKVPVFLIILGLVILLINLYYEVGTSQYGLPFMYVPILLCVIAINFKDSKLANLLLGLVIIVITLMFLF